MKGMLKAISCFALIISNKLCDVDWQLAMSQSKEIEQLQMAQREQLEKLDKYIAEVEQLCSSNAEILNHLQLRMIIIH